MARVKEETGLAQRLVKFAGPLASSSNNFRVTASGRIEGLLQRAEVLQGGVFV